MLVATGGLLLLVASCKRAKEILPPGARAGYYVTTDGDAGGDGSNDAPWDIVTAFNGADGVIQPGDTVWIRGGTYFGPFTTDLTGTNSARIIVRAYPGERAIIDGKDTPSGQEILTVDGAYTTYWGLEVVNSLTQRTSTRHSGLYLRNAQNVRLINLIIHDTGMGIFGEPDARNCEIYGAIIYNGGWQEGVVPTGRSNGHALYMKQDASGQKIIRDNVMFNMFGLGFHAYADAGTGPLDNMTIEGNIIFNSGLLSDYTNSNLLVGGEDAATNITVQNNYTYFPPGAGAYNVRLGYSSTANGSFTFSGNYIVGGAPAVETRFWTSGSVQGNTISGAATLIDFRDADNAGYSWTNNTFYRDSTVSAWRWGGTAHSLPSWRTASGGLGAGDRGIAAPSTSAVAVRPNAYEPGRAHIVVYNWGNQTSIQANVGGILAAGDPYKLYNVQALFGSPVASGTYNGGGSITVPLGGVTPAQPIGGSPNAPLQTGPAFDVFLLVKS